MSPPGTGAKIFDLFLVVGTWHVIYVPINNAKSYMSTACYHSTWIFWEVGRTKSVWSVFKINPNFSSQALLFAYFTSFIEIIKWKDCLSLRLYWKVELELIKMNCWIACQHGTDWSGYFGSMALSSVLASNSIILVLIRTSWIFLTLCIEHTTAVICSCSYMQFGTHGVPKRHLGKSKQRCTSKGLALPFFLITLQPPELNSSLYLKDKSMLINCHLGTCAVGTEARSQFPGQHILFQLYCLVVLFILILFTSNKIKRDDSDICLRNQYLKD